MIKRGHAINLNGQFWTNIILFITMLIVLQQARIASNEYKAKNKPVVGIEDVKTILLLPEGDQRVGKPASWDVTNKQFLCDDKPADVQGYIIQVKIKNFGTEPALDLHPDIEICIGNNLFKKVDPEFKNSIIMPGQTMLHTSTISKESIKDAFVTNKQVKLKCNLKYTDLTKKINLFEYYAELIIIDKGVTTSNIVNAYLKDKR